MDVALGLDCEDMFKEITKKLYGEDQEYHSNSDDHSSLKPEDHITAFGLAALMQNGFPPPGILHANFQPKTDPAAEDKWTASAETLQWTTSRIASYNPAQKLFKCTECECVGFLSRVAEHWLGTHSNARVFACPQCTYTSAWARPTRLHLVGEHGMPDDRNTDLLVKNNPVLDEVTKYLQRLKNEVERSQAAAVAAAAAAVVAPPAGPVGISKRYGCPSCPYATDRRDLFTRHENIHREEKPFECYVCRKQFNRADHVKKHFLRMHRDHPYDLNRIRRQIPKAVPGNYYPKAVEIIQTQQTVDRQQFVVRQDVEHRVKLEQEPSVMVNNSKPGHSKKKGEKRYACCYCSWAGADNWCLKRHLNTHLKPFACGLCDYKAARSERLATHVSKVHNKKACAKCSFMAEDQTQLDLHLRDQHNVENRNIKVPNSVVRTTGYSGVVHSGTTHAVPSFGWQGASTVAAVRAAPVQPRQQGPARLFNYMEASDDEDMSAPRLTPHHTAAQDFPKAGDVRSSTDLPAATITTTVTSPAGKTQRSKKKKPRVPHDKENEKTCLKKKDKFTCHSCCISFKTSTSLKNHMRSHKNNSARSPLLSANRTSFTFEHIGTEDSEDIRRRARKQIRPKKFVPTDQESINAANPNNGIPTNDISNTTKKQTSHVNKSTDFLQNSKSDMSLKKHHKLFNLFMKRINSKKPIIVFKCKYCRMKFGNRYEAHLHSKGHRLKA